VNRDLKCVDPGFRISDNCGRVSRTEPVVIPQTFPNFTFNNRAGITDIDGDQIIFKNVGTGRFIGPGLADPSVAPGVPPYQLFANGIGGPLTGTYEVVATSGKYSHRYRIGQKFDYKGVAYNPSTPPTPGGSLGSVYVEVYGPGND